MNKIINNTCFFKANFYNTIIRELLNCTYCGLNMSALLMGLCTIDYMSVPLAKTGTNNNNHFKNFINDYMAKVNPKYGDLEIQNYIYAIRCSIVHVFGESEATLKKNIKPEFFVDRFYKDNHLQILQNKDYEERFFISIPNLVGEIIAAISEFFRINEPSLKTIIPEWEKKLFFLQSYNLYELTDGQQIFYKKIHPCLSVLDDSTKDCIEVASFITENIFKENNQ